MKIGRNDPCPCGSNRKYKKCCLNKQAQPPPQEVIEVATKVLQRQREEQMALRAKGIFVNYVKPCTYTNPKTGQKVRAWGIGNQLLHTRPEHETFHEFIVGYLQKWVMGTEWWREQLQAQEKHFLFKCFYKWDEWRKKHATEQNKIDEHTWYAITDGWAQTLSSLAFDVCTLAHTLQLPEHLLKRLRNRAEYQGAHYEIAIAAIFARLGCQIEFLDKEKLTVPHCEFIATHNETGVSIAVETKSRQKPGVKHAIGSAERARLLRGDVEGLFKKALSQNPTDKPFIIFIDVNTPLTPLIPMEDKPWFKDIRNMLEKYPAPTPEKPEKYTGLIFTNFSPHYNEENESLPNEHLAVIPLYATHPMPNPIFGEMLLKAVQNYGFIPNIVEDKEI